MRLKVRKILLLVFLGFGVLCRQTIAEEDVAILSVMIGQVEYSSAEADLWKGAAEGMELHSGERVRTGADGMVSIIFSNGSLVNLKPNTQFKIESLSISEDKRDVDYKLELVLGKLRAAVEKLSDGSSVEIKTPTAVAAVRGTVYYLIVREVSEEEIPAEVRERLVTEIFVERDGVIFINTMSGSYYVVYAEQTSNSYGDGNIDVPIEIPPEKQLEWTEGWEDILAAEPYETPDETAEVTVGETGGEGEEVNNVRQSDQQNVPLNTDLIKSALQAVENALEAASNAETAANGALEALAGLSSKQNELSNEKNRVNNFYGEVEDDLLGLKDNYNAAYEATQEAEDAINGIVTDENTGAKGYVIVDVNALRQRLGSLVETWEGIKGGMSNLEEDYNELTSNSEDLRELLRQVSDESLSKAQEAEKLAERLQSAIDDAIEKGAEAGYEVLQLQLLRFLVELTQDAINRANEAARLANEAASNAGPMTSEIPPLISEMNGIIQSLNEIAQNANQLRNEFGKAIEFAIQIIEDANNFLGNELLARAIAEQEQHEKDVVRQELHNRLLERAYLRQQVRVILRENDLRRLDGYIEKISDAKMGKVLRDIHGNRVRVEQYILRPSKREVEVLNVNLRAGDELTTMQWMTKFNKSLDGVSTGGLRNLFWNSYLETKYEDGLPSHIVSPAHPDDIYPQKMSITFSHASDSFGDSFTEEREFSSINKESGIQNIDSQTLLVGNFNGNQTMGYALPGLESVQEPGTYSIHKNIRNADIGGGENNPQGFQYSFRSLSGKTGSIDAAFYVVSDNGERQDGFNMLEINDIGDALMANMLGSNKQVGDNNLEMVFNSTAFQYGPIDLIYVPFGRMEWKPDDHIPDFSLPKMPPEEPSESLEGF